MGTWSTGLYRNDTTCDVRDTYVKLLQQQLSDEEAYQQMREQFQEYMGDEEEPLFWYALAQTQWKLGRLMPEVKEKALEWVAKDGGLDLYDENKRAGERWLNTLSKLKAELESPMPERKVIKKPVEFDRNPWNVGDVYAYQFHTELAKKSGLYEKYILFRKVGDTEWYDDWILSAIQVYDVVYDEVPSLSDVQNKRVLPLVFSDVKNLRYTESEEFYQSYFPRFLGAAMVYEKKVHYPKKHLTFVGNCEIVDENIPFHRFRDMYWEKDGMEEWLIEYYFSWQGVEY